MPLRPRIIDLSAHLNPYTSKEGHQMDFEQVDIATIRTYLPHDLERALLVGRIWRKTSTFEGPCVVVIRGGRMIDVTEAAPTTADLFDRPDLVRFVRECEGEVVGDVAGIMARQLSAGESTVTILAPCDVQAVKACGVTFAVSLIERVIEERAAGQAGRAMQVRETIQRT
ncbi:MAG: hypothetical protein ACRYHA_23750, partial [Janthinobacterium lividum]